MMGWALVKYGTILAGLLAFLTSCEQEVMEVDCNLSDLDLSVTEVDYSDCGVPNGAIFVRAEGGNSPYQFRINGSEWQSENGFLELESDFYTIEVMDASGCLGETRTFVGSNEGVTAFATTTPAGCGTSNGSITMHARNGVEPYKYQLGENNDNYTNSPVFEGLSAGHYSVWVSDANDCFMGIFIDVPSGISWLNEVAPIIEANCNADACHGQGQSLDFTTHKSVQENANEIKEAILDRSMPVDGELSRSEIDAIICWIDDGAPSN